MVEEILTPEQREALRERGQVDFAYTLGAQGRFRSNAYRQQRGVDAVFRVIPPKPPTLEELGLPSSLARLANYHQGMVLLTGPAGCGKSSTLAALLNIINEDRHDHIITIEDPIEYIHPSKKCVVNQRQVGPHTGSFARALRGALREDPDIIAIGELRDLETIALALTAAETGHLVLATLHTNNAVRTVNRILGVFPPNQQDQIRTMVSESLRAVVSQRLVAKADGNGRVPALEILMANKAVGNLIRENKTFQIKSVLQTGATHGMCLLDASLAELVKNKVITRDEAARNAEDPQRFGAPPS
jgi:twitching motility protein PilT